MWGGNLCDQIPYLAAGQQCGPLAVPIGTSGVLTLSAGYETTLAMTDDGSLYSWGCNSMGQVGTGVSAPTPVPTPTLLTIPSKTIQFFTAGGYHNGAVTTDGSLYMWGYNGNGQLGDGTFTNQDAPILVTTVASPIASLDLGKYHSGVIFADGTIQTWGSDGYCQLGNGMYTDSNLPISVTGITDPVASISLGAKNTGAVTTAKTLWTWGSNINGGVGNGGGNDQCNPVLISVGGFPVLSVAFGPGSHACAIVEGGSLMCWGTNTVGQLGVSPTVTVLAVFPIPVGNFTAVAQTLSLGMAHTVALTTGGAVYLWGDNSVCQVGGSALYTSVPTKTIASGISQISSGGYFISAIAQ